MNNLKRPNGDWDIQKVINAHLAIPSTHIGSNRLYATDVGKCQRKALLRVIGVKPTNTEEQTMGDKLPWIRVTAAYGNIVEEALTGKALTAILQERHGVPVDWNPSLKAMTPQWSCRPDFVIGHGTDDVTLVEHKVTGGDHKPSRWKIDKRYYPYPEHVAQLALCGYVYERGTRDSAPYRVSLSEKRQNDKTPTIGDKITTTGWPRLLLFYRTYKNHAQFRVHVSHERTWVTGHINGESVEYDVDVNPLYMIREMERLWEAKEVPAPFEQGSEGWSTQCNYFGRMNCKYYDHCHGGTCHAVPFDVERGNVVPDDVAKEIAVNVSKVGEIPLGDIPF